MNPYYLITTANDNGTPIAFFGKHSHNRLRWVNVKWFGPKKSDKKGSISVHLDYGYLPDTKVLTNLVDQFGSDFARQLVLDVEAIFR